MQLDKQHDENAAHMRAASNADQCVYEYLPGRKGFTRSFLRDCIRRMSLMS